MNRHQWYPFPPRWRAPRDCNVWRAFFFFFFFGISSLPTDQGKQIDTSQLGEHRFHLGNSSSRSENVNALKPNAVLLKLEVCSSSA
jgi:hypothetical protein